MTIVNTTVENKIQELGITNEDIQVTVQNQQFVTVIDSKEQSIVIQSQDLQTEINPAPETNVTIEQTTVNVDVGDVTSSIEVVLQGTQGPAGPVGLSNWHQEEVIITPTMIQQKKLFLESVPTRPRHVELSVFGGIEQRPFHDFNVYDNVIDWDSLALEMLIDEGTAIAIRYYRG